MFRLSCNSSPYSSTINELVNNLLIATVKRELTNQIHVKGHSESLLETRIGALGLTADGNCCPWQERHFTETILTNRSRSSYIALQLNIDALVESQILLEASAHFVTTHRCPRR